MSGMWQLLDNHLFRRLANYETMEIYWLIIDMDRLLKKRQVTGEQDVQLRLREIFANQPRDFHAQLVDSAY